jgi:hypothetical protein
MATVQDQHIPPIAVRAMLDDVSQLPEKSNRGDKTQLELFLAGVQGWEAGLRRRMGDGKPKLE